MNPQRNVGKNKIISFENIYKKYVQCQFTRLNKKTEGYTQSSERHNKSSMLRVASRA